VKLGRKPVAAISALALAALGLGVVHPLQQALAQGTGCSIAATSSPLSTVAEAALFHPGAMTPIEAPDGNYYTTVNGQEPAVYTSIEEVNPAGQELWSYPLGTSALDTASTGNDLAALYPCRCQRLMSRFHRFWPMAMP
jgi:hypothetical protein